MHKFASCTVLTKSRPLCQFAGADGSTQLTWEIVRAAAPDVAGQTGAIEPLRSWRPSLRCRGGSQ